MRKPLEKRPEYKPQNERPARSTTSSRTKETPGRKKREKLERTGKILGPESSIVPSEIIKK